MYVNFTGVTKTGIPFNVRVHYSDIVPMGAILTRTGSTIISMRYDDGKDA